MGSREIKLINEDEQPRENLMHEDAESIPQMQAIHGQLG